VVEGLDLVEEDVVDVDLGTALETGAGTPAFRIDWAQAPAVTANLSM